jgi:predicted P-loop ATPase
VEGIRYLLPQCLGAEDTPVTELIAKIFLIGMVAKVYEPSTKFDFVLDLVGGQGVGKTTFLEVLSCGYYTQNITDFNNKDDKRIMLKNLIVNDDEMAVTNKMSFEDTKKFVTQTDLEFRSPYGRREDKFHKNFVLARTTNHTYYLKDKTGDRRFLPVLCSQENQKQYITPEIARLVIGEAVHHYRNNFSFELNPQQKSMLEQHRTDFKFVDETESLIHDYLKIPIPKNFYERPAYTHQRKSYIKQMLENGKHDVEIFKCLAEQLSLRTEVTINQISWEVFGIKVDNGRPPKDAMKFKHIMDHHPDWKFQTNPTRKFIRK